MDLYSTNARQATICFVLISTLLVFVLLPLSKVRFSTENLGGISYLFAVCMVASVYCWKRNMIRLAPSLEAVALGIFLTVPMVLSTYLAASLNMPLMDTMLARADAAIGFDWIAFIQFVDAYPLLEDALAKAYSSFAIQLLTLPLILGATGRYGRSYAMILAYGVICYVSSVVSIWFPALSTYTTYGVTQDQLQNINAFYGFHFLSDFFNVREQSEYVMSITSASGIVTFPSVHAAGAFLCAWAAWEIKLLRYPVAAWNALMAASALSHGSHYLVDIIAGIAIAAVSIFGVTEMLRRLQSPLLTLPMRPAAWLARDKQTV